MCDARTIPDGCTSPKCRTFHARCRWRGSQLPATYSGQAPNRTRLRSCWIGACACHACACITQAVQLQWPDVHSGVQPLFPVHWRRDAAESELGTVVCNKRAQVVCVCRLCVVDHFFRHWVRGRYNLVRDLAVNAGCRCVLCGLGLVAAYVPQD